MICCTYLEMALMNKVDWIKETEGKIQLSIGHHSSRGEVTLGVSTSYDYPDNWMVIEYCPFCGKHLVEG